WRHGDDELAGSLDPVLERDMEPALRDDDAQDHASREPGETLVRPGGTVGEEARWCQNHGCADELAWVEQVQVIPPEPCLLVAQDQSGDDEPEQEQGTGTI